MRHPNETQQAHLWLSKFGGGHQYVVGIICSPLLRQGVKRLLPKLGVAMSTCPHVDSVPALF